MEAKSHRKKKSNGTYCCVVNCHRNTAKDQGIVSFFRFPKSNPEQRQEWIKAVHRRNQDGSDWIPNTNTRICSDHFVSGWWSRTRDDPDYKPTKFPTRHVQEKSEQDVQRYERFKARSLSQDFQHFSIESDLEKDGRDFVEVSFTLEIGKCAECQELSLYFRRLPKQAKPRSSWDSLGLEQKLSTRELTMKWLWMMSVARSFTTKGHNFPPKASVKRESGLAASLSKTLAIPHHEEP